MKRIEKPNRMTPQNLLRVLRDHIGANKGAHMDDLVVNVNPNDWHVVKNEAMKRKLRELIVELRLEGYHICGHPSTGYYMAETPEELDRTCLFLYDRAMTSLQQIAAMKRISLPDLRGQLKLPT